MLQSWSTVDQLCWMFSCRFNLLINRWSTQSNILPYTVNIIDNSWSTSWLSGYSTCWSTVDQLFLLDFNFVNQQLSNLLLQLQLVEQLLINLLKPNTVGFQQVDEQLSNFDQLFPREKQLVAQQLINFRSKVNLLINSWSTFNPPKVDQQLLNFCRATSNNKLINCWSTWAKAMSSDQHVDQLLINFEVGGKQVLGSHRKSQEVTGSHRNSQEVTGSHRKSQEVTGSHKKSQEVTGSHRKSQGFSGFATIVEGGHWRPPANQSDWSFP